MRGDGRSGLAPVTSPVDAIPEFVEQGNPGSWDARPGTSPAISSALAADGSEFQRFSAGAHAAIMRKAAASDVTDRALAIIASTGTSTEGRP